LAGGPSGAAPPVTGARAGNRYTAGELVSRDHAEDIRHSFGDVVALDAPRPAREAGMVFGLLGATVMVAAALVGPQRREFRRLSRA